MPLRIRTTNYKALRRVDFTPEGVCALTGPNGSGKSTLLYAIELLRLATEEDLARALRWAGDASNLKTYGTPPAEACRIELSTDRPDATTDGGEQRIEWAIDMDAKVLSRPHETLRVGGRPFMERVADFREATIDGISHLCGDRLALIQTSVIEPQAVTALVSRLEGYRVYGEYNLTHLREIGSSVDDRVRLSWNGTNLFSVLRNWQSNGDHEARWDFVNERLRRAFPTFFSRFDFVDAVNLVKALVRTPNQGERYPASDWPNGFFAMALSLVGIAGTPDGHLVAFDEAETGLHPELIRQLIDAARTWSDRHGVTVLFATHSPVLLNEFDDEPEQVFVMTPRSDLVQPQPLTDLQSAEAIGLFELGDWYGRNGFGSPRG